MTAEQTKAYKELQNFAATQLKNNKLVTIKSRHDLKLYRLHQISCGFIGTDDGSITEFTNNRVSELSSILEETDGKIIIWANYRHDIKRIEKLLTRYVRGKNQ